MRTREQKSRHFLPGSKDSYMGTIIGGVLLLVFVTGVIFLGYKARVAKNPQEFEGKIVDKWAGYSHSQEGSQPYFRLLIEDNRGQKITVAVDQNVYHRSQVGARIRKTANGIELDALVEPSG